MNLKHIFYLNSVLLIPAALAFLITPLSMLGAAHITTAEPGVLRFARNTGACYFFSGWRPGLPQDRKTGPYGAIPAFRSL